MDRITSFFLRGKHWQVFLVLVAPGCLLDVALARSIPATQDLRFETPFVVLGFAWVLCYLCWLGAMGIFLNKIVGQEMQPRLRFFRIALVFVALYTPAFMGLLPLLAPTAFIVVLPLHFFAVGCVFYLWQFIAKNLVLAEKGREVEFPQYMGAFLLLWLFPIGIWFLQPRINRLYAARDTEHPALP